ncbi:class I SAM-dependent methyltransferase [Candidatus Bathyarchaeota archaeon A05DMB-2]|jgi:hypothetical protein|nr:class I SAM-dependent methyltransferase [Candidatus Bathyarchaeota archaeon A05DMB-2]
MGIISRFFYVLERMGYHVTPVDYYQAIPDTRTLTDELWKKPSELVGIDINEKGQLALLSLFSSKFKDEYERFHEKHVSNPSSRVINTALFGGVDADVLYCMIRHLKPRRIIEIGSGCSTYLSSLALLTNKEEDASYNCELVAIDPYPDEFISTGFPGFSELITKRVQDVPPSYFGRLEENDILFIDSTHVLSIGSDVRYVYLEILPRLNRGVVIHSHDIFMPCEYPKQLVFKEFRFWNEQYLLQAFLAFNDCFEVLWAGAYMDLNHPDELAASFSSYNRKESVSSSFWIRRKK